jgi:hypothetical protein
MIPDKEGIWEWFAPDGTAHLSYVCNVAKRAKFVWLRSYWRGGYYDVDDGDGTWGNFVGNFSDFTQDELDKIGS